MKPAEHVKVNLNRKEREFAIKFKMMKKGGSDSASGWPLNPRIK
jgi:hypothetical protein